MKKRNENRVLLISGISLGIHGGRERWIIETAKFLRRIREVSVLAFTNKYEYIPKDRLIKLRDELKRLGVQYYEIETIRVNLGAIKRIPLSISKLRQILEMHDVIYIAGDIFLGILTSILIMLLVGRRIKVIIGLHVSPSYKRLLYATSMLKVLNKLHVINNIHTVNTLDFIKLKRMGIGNVIYIPNFVDCSRFKPIVNKRNDIFQVLFVGALDLRKGIDIFLKMAREFRKLVPGSDFVIASYGGPWETEVLKHTRDGIIKYLGFVVDEELVKLYSESHVLIMPSREEPFGLVAIEAQACGTPVITSDISSFKLTVKDGVSGFRVKNYDDLNEWVDRLYSIYKLWMNNREGYYRMSIEARKYVCSKFYVNVINSLIRILLIIKC